jgi:hypothetical protein
MRAAHAWRLFLLLPDKPELAASLSGIIDSKCSIHLFNDKTSLTIDPAYIVDVPSNKGKKFLLVIETCFETQKDLGPDITSLYQQEVSLQIGKPGAVPEEPIKAIANKEMSEEKKSLLLGLHRLFSLSKFHQFLTPFCAQKEIAVSITDEKTCKAAFKAMIGIDSCRDLSIEAINSWRNAFNEWLRGGK